MKLLLNNKIMTNNYGRLSDFITAAQKGNNSRVVFSVTHSVAMGHKLYTAPGLTAGGAFQCCGWENGPRNIVL